MKEGKTFIKKVKWFYILHLFTLSNNLKKPVFLSLIWKCQNWYSEELLFDNGLPDNKKKGQILSEVFDSKSSVLSPQP